ncbi:MAG: hypothetical protein J5889_04830 [Clostridia bacterium]|nr:hypothetical protein [Clostridia bacterium]
MKKTALALCLLILAVLLFSSEASETYNGVKNMNSSNLPRKLYGGMWGSPAGHLQGIACDENHDYMYMSFTDRLVKVDMHTCKTVASVTGLLAGGIYGGGAHLGCLAYYQGHVYGSLEYKAAEKFYVAVFDCEKMTAMDMDYKTSGVMTTMYMDEVVRDYTDSLDAGEHDNAAASMGHRYGCSGIDGITFGPLPGDPNGKTYMYLAYGIYGNTERADNDYQVILTFDPDTFAALPFDQNTPHQTGPALYKKLFVYTGNTTYGVQNLEYDKDTGDLWMIVYPGKKEQYPNFPVYVVDGSVPVAEEPLRITGKAYESGIHGEVMQLKAVGRYHAESGVWGVPVMPIKADTGFISLGSGLFYVADSGKTDGRQYGYAVLMRMNRDDCTFERAE